MHPCQNGISLYPWTFKEKLLCESHQLFSNVFLLYFITHFPGFSLPFSSQVLSSLKTEREKKKEFPFSFFRFLLRSFPLPFNHNPFFHHSICFLMKEVCVLAFLHSPTLPWVKVSLPSHSISISLLSSTRFKEEVLECFLDITQFLLFLHT